MLFDIHAILEHLPHRYPFLLVDRVLEAEPGKFVHAYKNVTINEPYFIGHFPKHPVMPGVLILEALAQAGGILAFHSLDLKNRANTVFYFATIDNVRFKKPVFPGDQLHFHVTVTHKKTSLWKFHGVAKVDGEIAAEADLMCVKKDL